MKYIVFLIVFASVLSFKLAAVAEEHAAATCTAENKTEACTDHHAEESAHKSGHSAPAAARDWTHKRLEQVAAILPQPTANKAKATTPEKVSLVSPSFMQTVSGSSVELKWSESALAKSYIVQVSKDAGFNNRSMYIFENKNVIGTTITIQNLEPGTKYFWRVSAMNNQQDSEYTKSAFSSSSFNVSK